MERILVINNDFDTMDLIKDLLQKKGYMAEYTGRREEVSRLIDSFKPDLILLDILQQDLFADIKAAGGDIPILLMTGYSNQYDTPDIPLVASIQKPFTMEQLVSKIESIQTIARA